jgi:hypothetical protein
MPIRQKNGTFYDASAARNIYRTRDEQASECFIVGNPEKLFADLRDRLSKHDADSQARLDIEAQARRARLLLAGENYNIAERKWQEKIAYTLGCLATINRRLEEGAEGISKNQPGHHIRGFVSRIDNSGQFYKLFVPSARKPGTPLPLLVMVSTLVSVKNRPFIAGPVMAAHRHALQWGNYAEKHGFAILWPGYRNAPEGQTCEAVHIEEAIQAVERDYDIDPRRISVYASCSAGLFAGRLVSEYNNRFAAIVYDRALFERPEAQMGSIPSFREWCRATAPVRHVLGNCGLRIFVMHDNTAEPGHGEMALSTRFLTLANETRDDVVHCLGKRPLGTTPMDLVFSWLAPCRNENPGNTPSRVLAGAGYLGPLSEVFATPFIVVEGTGAQGRDRENMRLVVEFLKNNHARHFHGAACVVKKDRDVTQDDIGNNSLVLIGNPDSNSVWAGLRRQLPVNVTSSQVLYKNALLTGGPAFEAALPHPRADGKYVLLIGAADLRQLPRVMATNPFTAWYDCIILDSPRTIIARLSTINGTGFPSGGNAIGAPPAGQPPTTGHSAR